MEASKPAGPPGRDFQEASGCQLLSAEELMLLNCGVGEDS